MTAEPAKVVQILWNGKPLGVIEEPFWEMFNVSGRWVPAEGGVYEQFLAQLRTAGEAGVSLGDTLTGVVDEVPETGIAISFDFPRR